MKLLPNFGGLWKAAKAAKPAARTIIDVKVPPHPPNLGPMTPRQVGLLEALVAVGAHTARGTQKAVRWGVRTKQGNLALAALTGAYISHRVNRKMREMASGYLMPNAGRR